MRYHPKLKIAMKEIQEVLSKHDIAGLIVLHTPGFSEYSLEISPSYSCAKKENNDVRIKAKLQEDFNGEKEAQIKKLTDTSNMFKLLTDVSAMNVEFLMQISDLLDKHVDAEHGKGNHTSHTEQNN